MQRLILITAAFAVAASARADDAPVILDDVTVTTATRTETNVDDALSTVTIITRDDIERSQADRLSEVLRFVSGLDVVRAGGPGQQTSLFLRGSESNHTLVLIDGVRMNPATIGGAAVQNVPSSMIAWTTVSSRSWRGWGGWSRLWIPTTMGTTIASAARMAAPTRAESINTRRLDMSDSRPQT